MRLTIIGCAGSVAGPGNPASSYLVEADADGRTWRLLLDLGGGSVGALQAAVDPAGLDGILISHGHPDHCADLASLSVLFRYGPASKTDREPLPLWGPQGIDDRVRQCDGGMDDSSLEPFSWQELVAGETRTLGPFVITPARAWHPVPAFAYRIEGPAETGGRATLVFTGDTDLCDDVIAIARGADVLLAEAGWADRDVNPPGVHLTGQQAGELARRAGVRQLVVTHVPSWVDPAATLAQTRTEFPEATLAAPGIVFAI
ncbi:MBL fold metallo-hydrolase [Demequina sp. TTPB684]|uniref:MBL fold metallo-hydrolase n=1 Tax=unclassified Demequina TaxID=2620311 RepID=UPI001CF3AC88|nr:MULTISPECIES: MBL fold metallo-hydrolase [unclassified Demequina]MCB2413495.1 MBL fold metallo-hydrolase [Demequina sp. TTPB684]UPU87185.1 MBL fold metallo-hydrolase [Demequina sp. TMPB413]